MKAIRSKKTVLFSPVGGTDPISNCRDGAILHICRRYKPDCVMLYLSEEMLKYHDMDDRYRSTLRLLEAELGFHMEILEEKRPKLSDPHLFDTFYGDFEGCIHRLQDRYPDHQLLLNLSSGTPAMKGALAVLTQIIDLNVQGIQVYSPRRRHNGERESLDDYDIELSWECNDDRDAEKYIDRCLELQQENLRAKLMRETLIAHIKAYDYPAAVHVGKEMGALLPYEAMELLNAALLRSQVRWREIKQPLQSDLIERMNGREQDIFEYILSLILHQKRGELGGFLRGLTPALYALSVYALKKATKIDLEAACDKHGRLVIASIPADAQNRLDRLYGCFDSKYINSDMCIKLLEDMDPEHPYVAPLSQLRAIEINVRNIAAHTLQPITEELIKKGCASISSVSVNAWNSGEIAKLLKKCTETIFDRTNLRWNSYELMNEKIKKASSLKSDDCSPVAQSFT